MGSNCQLSPPTRRPGCKQNAVSARASDSIRSRAVASVALALLINACADDPAGETTDTEPGTSDTAATETASEDPTSGSTNDTLPDTGEVGPNFGLLTFTFYPADASGSPEQLGMAGAWRTTPFTTDDFFAARSLALFFPPPPAAADTPELHDPAAYAWGKADTWLTLGNGLRLRHPDGDALACLQVLDELYPVYLSDDAAFFDPACAPDPTRWQPGARYDLVAYGGADFDDAQANGAVTTPSALTLTAPDASVFDFPLAQAEDLTLQWTADGGPDDRVVIRVWDQFGKQIAVNATDDGSYTLPAAQLAPLSAGPATITIAREHISTVDLLAGSLRVVARHELWLYPDLF